MSISYGIDVRLGSPAQVNAGILGKAKVTMFLDEVPLVTLDDIYIRKGKTTEYWIAWSSKQDSNGKTDPETGRVISYPNYKAWPQDLDKRKQLEAMIWAQFQASSRKAAGPQAVKPAQRTGAAPKPKMVPVQAPAPVESEELDFTV